MIGKFLRTRRGQLVRADFGLPPIARGSSGLRREEVAYLARVSITWYTRLEQGRAITPSRQVLDALAQMAANLVELRALANRHRTRPGERDGQILNDRRRAPGQPTLSRPIEQHHGSICSRAGHVSDELGFRSPTTRAATATSA